jgi:hypothetical protein
VPAGPKGYSMGTQWVLSGTHSEEQCLLCEAMWSVHSSLAPTVRCGKRHCKPTTRESSGAMETLRHTVTL